VCANMEIQYTGSLITTQIDNLVHQDCPWWKFWSRS
jgi:hypothetical protein